MTKMGINMNIHDPQWSNFPEGVDILVSEYLGEILKD